MKLRLDKETQAYMDFITANRPTEYLFVGSAQIFLDKVLWMDEHFRKLPEGYDSIFEVENLGEMMRILNVWEKNPAFSMLNESQNDLYRKALDYLCEYRKTRKSEPEIEEITVTKEPVSENPRKRKSQTEVIVDYIIGKANRVFREYKELLQKAQRKVSDVSESNRHEKPTEEAEQRDETIKTTKSVQIETPEEEKTTKTNQKNIKTDKVVEGETPQEADEEEKVPAAVEKKALETEETILIKKRVLRVLKGWERRKATLYGRRFRKVTNQLGGVPRWKKTENAYEQVVLPNGKRWNDVVSMFKGEALLVLRHKKESKAEEPVGIAEAQTEILREKKIQPVERSVEKSSAERNYKPLTKLTTKTKEAKTNAELLKVEVKIPRALKTEAPKASFYVWLLLSKNLTQSRAEDAVHLMDVCDEVSEELGISDQKVYRIEDTEELIDYVEKMEADHRFRKIDRKFFCKISQSLEWYCEFATENARYIP